MKIRQKTNKNVYVSNEQVVDRSAWVFGGDEFSDVLGDAEMLNDKGNMCCLGHICHNSGFGADALESVTSPEAVLEEFIDNVFLDIPYLVYQSGELTINSLLSDEAMRTNDNPKLSLAQREKALKALFKDEGITLKFVGKYPKEVLELEKEKDNG